MAGGGHGVVQVPWYATLFRGEQLEEALAEIAPVAMRYGASEYEVFRSRDDQYRFVQVAYFESAEDWERYWYGEEFSRWRTEYGSWYQVPVLYYWNDVVAKGVLTPETELEAAESDGA
jgi:hypothetical protein